MIHKTRSESGTIRALLRFCDQFKDSLQGFVDAFLISNVKLTDF